MSGYRQKSWSLKLQRRVERAALKFLELFAISVALVALGALVIQIHLLKKIFAGTTSEVAIAEENFAPGEVLVLLAEYARDCIAGRIEAIDRERSGSEAFYSRKYRTNIDPESLTGRVFSLSGGIADSGVVNRMRSWSDCIATRALFDATRQTNRVNAQGELDQGNLGVLSNERKIDSRVHWAYILIEGDGLEGGDGVYGFTIWPGSEIPDGFLPWERPWSRDRVIVDYSEVTEVEIRDIYGNIYQTYPYVDAFTRNHVVSLVLPQSVSFNSSGNGVQISFLAAVDVRVGNEDVYDRMLVLNYLICLLFWGLSSQGRSSKTPFLRFWYRSWLVMSVLYSLQVVANLAVPHSSVLGIFHAVGPAALTVISILSSYLFLMVAVHIDSRGQSTARPRRTIRIAIQSSFLVLLCAVFVDFVFRERTFPISPGEVVESGYSFIVILTFGLSLRGLLFKVTKSGSARLRTMILWGARGLIILFFGQGLLQLTIPLWPLSPFVEEIFWLLSIPAKAAQFSAFYIVVLFSLYWRRVRLNDLFVGSLRRGIIASDFNFSVVNINPVAARMLNLRADFVEGKDLRQVLFSSLVEAEGVFAKVRQGNKIENLRISGKCFPRGEDDVDCIEVTEWYISCYPAVSEFDEASLVIIVLSDEEVEETQELLDLGWVRGH